ncbi:MAG: glycosyltransferase family 4 protein [Candidatus Omnitrophota bacterium]
MRVVLIFTYGVSLGEWRRKGLLDREILIYKRLVREGHEVSFVTYGADDDLLIERDMGGIKVFPVFTRIKKSSLPWVNVLKSFLIPFRFRGVFRGADVIKTNQMQGSWVGLIARYIYGKRLVVRCGFEWYRNAYTRGAGRFFSFGKILVYALEWISYVLGDEIIISSETDAEFIKRSFGIKTSKMRLIRNYVDTDIFKPFDRAREGRGRLLYIGRFEPRKNILSILKAVKDTPYRLDIIGYGEEEGLLRGYVRDNGVNAGFLELVPNNKLPGLFSGYDALVLASFYENSPKVILEAMSCGMPVIGTDVPGIRELIRHGENGFLCYTDTLSIRKAMETVMGDPAMRDNMGKNARKYILENCSLDKVFPEELNIYSRLTGEVRA